MKNILMVTPLYPLPTKENNCTYVCHFYTREWVKMGYNVMVIHAQPVHCRAWHLLVKMFGKQLNNFIGGGNYYARKIKKTEHYVMEDVPVYRVPIYNFIPRGRYPERSVQKFVREVQGILDSASFVPDVIVGHMTAIELIPEINKTIGAKTCMVAHGATEKWKERYDNWESLIDSYDSWGFRAKPIREAFEKRFKKVKKPFLCLSGIPAKYLVEENKHSFDKPLQKFLYIGDLMERKYPITLLEAIPQAVEDYSIQFVGEGGEREKLENYIAVHNMGERVQLVGKVPRDKVTDYLDESDCFIMVSRREAYGLVYLEAMARGCIAIASRDEGFDGVIVDSENGFLCEAGNAGELAQIIQRINRMTPAQRKAISNNGLATARRMTDYEMAKVYVNHLETI